LGFLSSIIARSFIRRRDCLHAVDSLWYVNLALLVCLGMTVLALNWRANGT
jgi:hypothetical protein